MNRRFSALQRAENSSMNYYRNVRETTKKFQCSSASRKFLNRRERCTTTAIDCVSVLFSEPKIPQSLSCTISRRNCLVSVLFSEPKIPQYVWRFAGNVVFPCFSALQRAENSSIPPTIIAKPHPTMFQCSSASRKFLNSLPIHNWREVHEEFQCSSASRKFLNPA